MTLTSSVRGTDNILTRKTIFGQHVSSDASLCERGLILTENSLYKRVLQNQTPFREKNLFGTLIFYIYFLYFIFKIKKFTMQEKMQSILH